MIIWHHHHTKNISYEQNIVPFSLVHISTLSCFWKCHLTCHLLYIYLLHQVFSFCKTYLYINRYQDHKVSIIWPYLIHLWYALIFFKQMEFTDLLKSGQSHKLCLSGFTNVSFCYLNSIFRDSWSYLQILL
jgi:hypothetical protein